jgi:hypothetical protein
MRNIGNQPNWNTWTNVTASKTPSIDDMIATARRYQEEMARLPCQLHMPKSDYEAMQRAIPPRPSPKPGMPPERKCHPLDGLPVYILPDGEPPYYVLGNGQKVPVRVQHDPFDVIIDNPWVEIIPG